MSDILSRTQLKAGFQHTPSVKTSVLVLVLVVSLCVLPVFLVRMVEPEPGAGWLTGWRYRKSHVVGNATGAGTEYQVSLVVHAGWGIDDGSDAFVNGHCTDFPNDIRFTDDNGTTLLDHWLESSTATEATFWVELQDNLNDTDATIYIYYGNLGESSLSNGDNTFLFFDDFLGSTLNASKWTEWGSNDYVSVSGGILTMSDGNENKILSQEHARQYNYAWHARWRVPLYDTWGRQSGAGDNVGWTYPSYDPTNSLYIQFSQGLSGKRFARGTIANTRYDYNSDAVNPESDYHITEIRRVNGSVTYHIDDTLFHTQTSTLPTVQVKTWLRARNEGNWDWVFTCKYVSPEPQHGSWGDEESDLSVTEFDVNYYPTNPYPYVASNLTRANEPVLVTASVAEPVNFSSLHSVHCAYRVNSGIWWNTTMSYNTSMGGWMTTIPGQPGNTTVQFFLTAYGNTDNADSSTTYSYYVTALPIGDIDGSNKVGYADLGWLAYNYGQSGSLIWDLLDEDWDSLSGWTLSGSGTSEILPAGQLHHVPDNGTRVFRYRDVGSLPESGYTVEFRLQVDSFGSGDGVVSHQFYDGLHSCSFGIRSNRVFNWYGGNITIFEDTDNQWHTWRLLVDSDGESMHVYKDDTYLGDLGGGQDYVSSDGTIYAYQTKNNEGDNGCESHADYLKIATGLFPPT